VESELSYDDATKQVLYYSDSDDISVVEEEAVEDTDTTIPEWLLVYLDRNPKVLSKIRSTMSIAKDSPEVAVP